MWEVTQARFEDVLIRRWQQMSIKSPRLLFIRTFMKELELFLEAEPFKTALRRRSRQEPDPRPGLVVVVEAEGRPELVSV